MPALQYLMNCMTPLLMMVVFYVNYFWLTPRNFVIGKRRYYLLFNLIMVVSLGVFLHMWVIYTRELFQSSSPYYRDTPIDILSYIIRDILSLGMSAGVATAIVLATQWQRNEEERLEAENARVDAELKNLRSQINPHFLLNTLNNIYALTAFDKTRAQEAIQQLSKMMRHMLYDNQEEKVVLKDEIEFLENYVSLMKIRMSQNVEVTLEEDVENPHVKIAPLLFISLVENAFKHGVSPVATSFIHIKLIQKKDKLAFVIENTHHPKDTKDFSGHGIGLQQVQRRLELAYAGRYEWTKGTTEDGKNYISTIKIQL
jgi:sensor histidine kinase YesM